MTAPSTAGAGQRPHGVLDDGTPFFAPLGELQVVDDGDRVICHLCGRALQLLSAEHLRRHGWTPQLYRGAFGLNRSTPLCSPSMSAHRRALGADRYARNDRVRDGMARGQALAESGRLLELSHAAQARGAASLQRRRRSAAVTASSREAVRAAAIERRRQRIHQLGFATEREYLTDRYLVQGWSVARIKEELRIGSSAVSEIMTLAGIERRRPGGAGPAQIRWRRIATD